MKCEESPIPIAQMEHIGRFGIIVPYSGALTKFFKGLPKGISILEGWIGQQAFDHSEDRRKKWIHRGTRTKRVIYAEPEDFYSFVQIDSGIRLFGTFLRNTRLSEIESTIRHLVSRDGSVTGRTLAIETNLGLTQANNLLREAEFMGLLALRDRTGIGGSKQYIISSQPKELKIDVDMGKLVDETEQVLTGKPFKREFPETHLRFNVTFYPELKIHKLSSI